MDHFNSSMVQLKDETLRMSWEVTGFQFLYGTIKSRFFNSKKLLILNYIQA